MEELSGVMTQRKIRNSQALETQLARLHVDLLELYFPHTFLLLHPPVLEPDLHLGLVQPQRRRDLDPSGPGEIFVKMEFFFQFRQLFVCKVCAARPC